MYLNILILQIETFAILKIDLSYLDRFPEFAT
jgi:hypothetical protein